MKARRHIEAFLSDFKVRTIVAAEIRDSLAACEKHLDPATMAKVREVFRDACPYIESPAIVAMLERVERAGE